MIALLGLLAVAGYQNRDKIGDFLNRLRGDRPSGTDPAAAGTERRGGILEGLGDLLRGGDANTSGARPEGGIGAFLGSLFGGDNDGRDGIGGGLRDLFDRFKGNGHEDEARSWIETGPNRQISAEALEEALGEDTIAELTQRTGLSRADLVARLRDVLPMAVDQLTPEGRLPPAPAPFSPQARAAL
jgi:uncharacterized protein YidB (DUF937 family)